MERERSSLKSEREKSSLEKRPTSSLAKKGEVDDSVAEAMFKAKLDENGDDKVTEADFIEIMSKLPLGFVGKHIAKRMFIADFLNIMHNLFFY
jgi:hypothetical protein